MSAHANSRVPPPVSMAGAMLLLAAITCALPATSVPPTQPPPPPSPTQAAFAWPGDESQPVRLEVLNQGPGEVCELYISPPADDTWGGDWLPPNQPIIAGGTRAFDVPAGHYDLLAVGCDGQARAEQRNDDLTLDKTWAVQMLAPASTPQPQERVTLDIYGECPQPAITPLDEVAVRVDWVAVTVQQAEENAAHFTFNAWVDGQLVTNMTPIAYPAGDYSPLDVYGCGPDELVPLAYWDLPIGRLSTGQHVIEVEYLIDAQIDDGFSTYSAGSLGVLDRNVTVGDATSAPAASLTIVNDTADAICFVWIGPPQSEWIDDLLGADILPAGTSMTVDVEPGTWALKADGCSGEELGYEPSYEIDGPTEWRIGR